MARVLPAIDATVARLSSGLPPREMEQAGRTLSSLTRALRELNALLAQHNAQPARQCDCDDEPVDIEQLRAELAERLMNIIDRKEEEYREKGSGSQTQDGALPATGGRPGSSVTDIAP